MEQFEEVEKVRGGTHGQGEKLIPMPYSSDFGISDPDYLKHSRLMINKCLHFFISIPFPSPTPSILITHTHPVSYSPALLPCCHTPHKKKETPKKNKKHFPRLHPLSSTKFI